MGKSHASQYANFGSLPDTVLQMYALVESLERERFDEWYAVYLLLPAFEPNSTDFVSLPLTMGRT